MKYLNFLPMFKAGSSISQNSFSHIPEMLQEVSLMVKGKNIITLFITVFLMLNLDTQNITLVNLHETGAYNEMYKSYINAIYRYFNVAEFLLLPILSFFTYIFFKSSGYNYAEMFILNTYLSAQRQLVNLIFILFIYFFPSNSVFINYISLAVLGIFFIWFYIDFFRSQKRSAVIFKSVIILLLFYTCILIILAAIFFLFYFE